MDTFNNIIWFMSLSLKVLQGVWFYGLNLTNGRDLRSIARWLVEVVSA